MTCSVVRVILMFTWFCADDFTIHMSHVPSSYGLAVDNIYSILNSDLDKSENENLVRNPDTLDSKVGTLRALNLTVV